ncbi:MAG TPA: type II CRISPR RNA-guided endonuclease Cas9, partial [Candidatus Cloacimonadota bacterium]|nr:type II CRISPR RNA-guided endonuclease Cas9 [Candidatus Cloacimonadota bacterium]
NKPELAPVWDAMNLGEKSRLIELLVSDLDEEVILKGLSELGIEPSIATQLVQLRLPSDYGNLSLEALNRILPYMREGYIYSKACELAGISHSGEYNGEVFVDGSLPYYGELLKRETLELNRKIGDPLADEYGKINNPSVHIALNQLRHLVNALCKRYGNPQEIVLELARELKLGKDAKDEIQKVINRNQKQNVRIAELLKLHGIEVNHDNLLRVKLWEELGKEEIDRRCVYTGRQISFTDLFSPQYEIEHILPKSRTYDDGNANKTISYYIANRYKEERSPWEAFGKSLDGYDWQGIVTRAKHLPDNKQWRFLTDAMDRFKDEEQVLARMLNDTRYMSRVAAKYMYYICGEHHVWTITGKHTSMLRAKWGLNSALGETDAKERTDHRHHAIDAFVIALTTRSFVKKLANTIRNSRERFIENLEMPYPGFSHNDFKDAVSSITVSYKPDQLNIGTLRAKNQTAGALSDESAYSFLCPDPENPKYHLYAIHKPVNSLSASNVDEVISPELRAELISLRTNNTSKDEFAKALAEWAKNRNVRKLNLLVRANPRTMIPVKDKTGRVFKYLASGENLFADIYIKDPTAPMLKWEIEIVPSYHAHQPGFMPQWKLDYPKGKKVMRLFKNDIVAIDTPEGGRELRRVKKMTNGIVYLRELSTAKKAKGTDDVGEQYSANRLKELNARKAGVDIMGRYFDPIINEDGIYT